jgi:hypothetical protein
MREADDCLLDSKLDLVGGRCLTLERPAILLILMWPFAEFLLGAGAPAP